MEQIKPNSNPWRRSRVKWDDLSREDKKYAFEAVELRKNRNGKIYKTPWGYYKWREKPKARVKRVTKPYGNASEYLGKDVNVQPVRKAVKAKPDWQNIAFLIAMAILAGIIVASLFNAIMAVYWENRFSQYHIEPDISPLQIYDYELKDSSWRLAGEAHAATLEPKSAQSSVEAMVSKYFGEYAGEALRCFQSESGLRPDAVNYHNRNGTWDIGLAQINTVHCGKLDAFTKTECREKLLDLETNVKMAYEIWTHRGWDAWYGATCY